MYILISLIAVFTILKLFLKNKEDNILKYLSTNFILFAVLGIVFIQLESIYAQLVIMGLVISTVADAYMLESKQEFKFMLGIILFFIVHILYIIALYPLFSADLVYYIAPLALVMGGLVGFLDEVFKKTIESKSFRIMVLVYMIFVCVMFMLALGTGNYLIIAGGVCFWMSDLIIGVNSFGRPMKYADYVTFPLYVVAQVCFAFSVFQF